MARREEFKARDNQNSSADLDAELERLAALSQVQYELERKGAAKRLNVRAPILDRLVKAKRPTTDDGKQGRPLSLPEPKPWPERVEAVELLCDLSAAIRKHVVMPGHGGDATALWVVHTYLLDAVHITPRLAITSPEKQCGKTTLLDVLCRLVWRPLEISNTTVSPIFRAIEKAHPTLLLDEGDTFLPNNEELRGVLNSGHRRGGSVLRTVGDDFEPRQFETFAPCAIAMIGQLPGTLADRSICIELQRRLAGEALAPFRLDRTEHLDRLASKAARWAADNADRVRAADPLMPPGVFNRVADNWAPLLAIADVAGGEGPQRARRALETIQATAEDASVRVQLLGDICAIFAHRQVDRLPSDELVKALIAIEGHPWAEWNAGKPLSKNGLARLLRPLKIRPGTKRIAGEKTVKGYYLSDFDDGFKRYLRQEGGFDPSHRHNADEMGTSEGFSSVTPEPSVTDEKGEKSNNDGHCDGVTDTDRGFAHAANGNGVANHRCDHCGQPGALAIGTGWDDRTASGYTRGVRRPGSMATRTPRRGLHRPSINRLPGSHHASRSLYLPTARRDQGRQGRGRGGAASVGGED
jgi:putative DNA primase/helicase